MPGVPDARRVDAERVTVQFGDRQRLSVLTLNDAVGDPIALGEPRDTQRSPSLACP